MKKSNNIKIKKPNNSDNRWDFSFMNNIPICCKPLKLLLKF